MCVGGNEGSLTPVTPRECGKAELFPLEFKGQPLPWDELHLSKTCFMGAADFSRVNAGSYGLTGCLCPSQGSRDDESALHRHKFKS